MNLIIAEKPSVAQSIANVLGVTIKKDGYLEGNNNIVTWCVGHLVELASADEYDSRYAKWDRIDLPIIPKQWQFKISKGKENQMNIIDKLMKDTRVTTVVAATDAGREGELIFRLVYNKLGCKKPIKRLWISSMEESAIRDGFANLRDGSEYELLYQSALCRSKADWLVGINATRFFSIKHCVQLNVGRVISPTLAMVVERELAINNFVSAPFYSVLLDLDGLILSSEKYENKFDAEKISSDCDGKDIEIGYVLKKNRKDNPLKLYDLTSLQRDANRLFGFTADQTLTLTQSLYEKKLVTYPRTDSRYLTEDMLPTIQPLIEKSVSLFENYNSSTLPLPNCSQVIDNSKVTDHHAIIPTLGVAKDKLSTLTECERSILELVAIRLVSATSIPHKYTETTITAVYNGVTFTTKGKTIIDNGFKSIEDALTNLQAHSESVSKAAPLPNVVTGDVFKAIATIKEGKTTPPKHFTDDTLLAAMENANKAVEDTERKGIGTPATRAGILEKLINTGLSQRVGDKKTKYFISTEKGISLISVLPEIIRSPLLTAEWEEKLKLIERGELSSDIFLSDICTMITATIADNGIENTTTNLFESEHECIGKCPRCKGDVVEIKKGFVCHDKSCGFALWRDNIFFTSKKKTLTKPIAKALLTTGKAEVTGLHSEKSGKNYNATVILDDTGDKYVNFKLDFTQKDNPFSRGKSSGFKPPFKR